MEHEVVFIDIYMHAIAVLCYSFNHNMIFITWILK